MNLRLCFTSLVQGLLLAAGCEGSPEQGSSDMPSLAFQEKVIVGGQEIRSIPAVGLLTYRGYTHCTATLISDTKILTAAHCLVGVSVRDLRFLIGPSLSDPDYVLKVAKITPHPDYDRSSETHDIGIVELSSKAPIDHLGVCRPDETGWLNKKLLFVGYGVSDGSDQTGDGIKRAVWMKVAEHTPYMYLYQTPGKNTCSGDSGGPAFYIEPEGRLLITGITSYGDRRCLDYGVNTRVDPYLDFLGA